MTLSTKRGLVLSYSPIARDPRVLRQIDWLNSNNYELTVFGLGDFEEDNLVKYIPLEVPSLVRRLALYLFASNQSRSKKILKSIYDTRLTEEISYGKFNFVLINDLDFLGAEEIFQASNASNTPILLDLHEYFPDLGGGILWKLFQSRYYVWLLNKLHHRQFSKVITVSEDIAKLYEREFGLAVEFIMNIPKKSQSNKRNVIENNSDTLRLVYHGAAGKGRGLLRIIKAVGLSELKVELTLILVCSKSSKFFYRLWAILCGNKKVHFRSPVPFSDISNMLSNFDAEVIFYHPPHSKNELLSLPNKFFEAVDAGLAILTGPSPSMASLVQKHDLGIVVKGWDVLSLRDSISELSREKIELHKVAAIKSLDELSETSQKSKFVEFILQSQERNSKPR